MYGIVRQLILQVLAHLRLHKRARSAVWRLRTLGVLPWKPLVPEDDFQAAARQGIQHLRRRVPAKAFGDYLEFGVSRGTSLACMYRALQQENLPRTRLIGFDSFEGLPPEAGYREGWSPGLYKSPLSTTRRYLARKGVDLSRVTLIKGWFKDTLTPATRKKLRITKASLIMIDCDIYSASREALWFCEPLIRDHAVVFFDDWGWRADVDRIGQREAFHEFLEEFPELASSPLPAYLPQARVFLVSRRTALAPAGSQDDTLADARTRGTAAPR